MALDQSDNIFNLPVVEDEDYDEEELVTYQFVAWCEIVEPTRVMINEPDVPQPRRIKFEEEVRVLAPEGTMEENQEDARKVARNWAEELEDITGGSLAAVQTENFVIERV